MHGRRDDGQAAEPRGRRFTSRHRTRLTAGIALVLPIWITILLVSLVFGVMRDASIWVLEAALASSWGEVVLGRWDVTAQHIADRGYEALPTTLRWIISLDAVLLTVGGIYLLGMIASNLIGRRLVRAAETVVDRLPFVKTVYRASKQVIETFAGGAEQSFQRVVTVPFPNRDIRSIGFVTWAGRNAEDGTESCAVFVPTTPNPTTGYLLLMRRSEVRELDWPVEEAVKVIMSAGVLLADRTPLAPAADVRPGSAST